MSRKGKIQRIQIGVPQFRITERAEENSELPALEGYAALFNTETDLYWFTESIAPGAFKDSIARGDDVRALVDHDPSRIIGRTPKTLSLKEDERGLFVTINPANTSIGRDIVESIKRGDVSQMSFGFMIDEEILTSKGVDGREKAHFTITRATLFDVSPVTFPAYTETEIGIARAEPSTEEEFKRRFDRARSQSIDPEAELQLRNREIDLLRSL